MNSTGREWLHRVVSVIRTGFLRELTDRSADGGTRFGRADQHRIWWDGNGRSALLFQLK